ncbi:putative membrane protein [Vibrio parahaemolyticus 10296]|nr:putative membrane protein [Vibrio parahaemolyticus 10296]
MVMESLRLPKTHLYPNLLMMSILPILITTLAALTFLKIL